MGDRELVGTTTQQEQIQISNLAPAIEAIIPFPEAMTNINNDRLTVHTYITFRTRSTISMRTQTRITPIVSLSRPERCPSRTPAIIVARKPGKRLRRSVPVSRPFLNRQETAAADRPFDPFHTR